MTAPPGSDDAHTDEVGAISDRMENYLDVLDDEAQAVEAILSELEGKEDGECLTVEEYRRVFPAEMPLEAWGGFGD